MRINLRTFEMVAFAIMAIGMIFSLSMILEIRICGYVMLFGSAYLIYQIGEERKRQRRRLAFLARMGEIIEERMAS